MTDDIRPAPIDWRGFCYDDGHSLQVRYDTADYVSLHQISRSSEWRVEIEPPPARHALAALCLYGQPFGFTRADLEALADVLRQPLARGTAAPLVGLSHRIAALLPPETT